MPRRPAPRRALGRLAVAGAVAGPWRWTRRAASPSRLTRYPSPGAGCALPSHRIASAASASSGDAAEGGHSVHPLADAAGLDPALPRAGSSPGLSSACRRGLSSVWPPTSHPSPGAGCALPDVRAPRRRRLTRAVSLRRAPVRNGRRCGSFAPDIGSPRPYHHRVARQLARGLVVVDVTQRKIDAKH